MSLRRCLLPAFATLLSAAAASGQQSIGAWTYDKGVTKLTLTGVFEPPPPTGYQPLRVEMTNGTTDRRAWSLDCRSNHGDNRTDSAFEVAAEGGRATTTMVLVPLSNAYDVGSYRWSGGHHQLTVRASSVQVGSQSGSTNDQRASGVPAIAISDRLAQKSLTQLNDEVRKVSSSMGYGIAVFGSRFDPAMLPEEWLGFSGFDYVLLTDDEWLQLSPGARAALLQWVRFSGQLHLYRASDAVTLASLGIPTTADAITISKHGLGKIELRSWSGNTLDAAPTVAAYRTGLNLRSHLSGSYRHASAWKLERNLGERNFAGWQVVLFLLLFGVLVGPVNLFVLAPAGRRHKLFFTTPVIAAGASLLLIVLILIQDGTGGKGRRFVAIEIAPDDATAYVTQEQISRTGVLLGSSFELPPSALCHQLLLEASPWTKLHDGRNSQGMNVRITSRRLSGNWFQSRTVQGQFLRAVFPTRGRIDLVPPASPDQSPVIVSSLEMELSEFAYVDETGQEWAAPVPVTQGRRTVLVKSPGGSGTSIRRKLETASDTVRTQIIPLTQQRSAFLATAAAAPGLALETLERIRWEDDQIIVFGKLAAQP